MAKGQYLSSYQRGIVNRYYSNLDTITLQKLQEAVSELYLKPAGKGADKLWKTVEGALAKAGAPADQATRVIAARDVEGLAKLVGSLAAPR